MSDDARPLPNYSIQSGMRNPPKTWDFYAFLCDMLQVKSTLFHLQFLSFSPGDIKIQMVTYRKTLQTLTPYSLVTYW